jgi:hypothetical protein
MLYDQDSSIVMMRPEDEHVLYKMDLERGRIVEEWVGVNMLEQRSFS